jgi:hypothetical protein
VSVGVVVHETDKSKEAGQGLNDGKHSHEDLPRQQRYCIQSPRDSFVSGGPIDPNIPFADVTQVGTTGQVDDVRSDHVEGGSDGWVLKNGMK